MEPGRKLDQRRGLKDPLAPAETVGKACVSGKCIWNRRGEPFDFKAVSIATSTHGTSLSLSSSFFRRGYYRRFEHVSINKIRSINRASTRDGRKVYSTRKQRINYEFIKVTDTTTEIRLLPLTIDYRLVEWTQNLFPTSFDN